MRRVLLLLVLLSPWLLAVWVGVHNLRQPRQLQLLTGTTPALPIGGWLLLSSSLGVTLGATAVGVLLQPENSLRRRRLSEVSLGENDHGDDEMMGEEPNSDSGHWRDAESSLGEPPPVMDVPFRVVRAARTPDPVPTPPDNAPAFNGDDWQPPQPEAW